MDVHIEKRIWSSLDTFIFFIRIFWIVFNVSINALPLYPDPAQKMLLSIWFLLILVVPYLFYRPGKIQLHLYLTAELTLTGSMFIFLVSQFHHLGPEILSIISFPLFTIAFVSQSRPYIWISPILSAVLVFTGALAGDYFFKQDSWGRFADMAMLYGFGFMLGRIGMMNQHRNELLNFIREKNKTLEQYTKRIEELVIKEERSRVSKDMHDTVGHVFTSVIASLDALPFIIKANKEAAVSSIQELSQLTRKGLADVRKTIHQLSGDWRDQALTAICQSLIDEFSTHTETIVDFQVSGHEAEITDGGKHVLMRSLQESLTNAKRHGQATNITVTLQFTETMILLRIKDNGVGREQIQYGFGLKSMKDRLINLGGSFHIESNEKQGTAVTCMVPVPKEWSEG
ncbi:sensor histidine kinase [Neobacillus sp. SAB-20_R2A]|uniref:sensor histidine kinase n=1 Tax=Neobacillus sp. SAB-20_R2A TaxID=3120519 RepID=UPI003C6E2E33